MVRTKRKTFASFQFAFSNGVLGTDSITCDLSKTFGRSQQNCAHVTTVTLSLHMTNFIAISWAHFKPEHSKWWSNFEFDWNPVSGTGARTRLHWVNANFTPFFAIDLDGFSRQYWIRLHLFYYKTHHWRHISRPIRLEQMMYPYFIMTICSYASQYMTMRQLINSTYIPLLFRSINRHHKLIPATYSYSCDRLSSKLAPLPMFLYWFSRFHWARIVQ